MKKQRWLKPKKNLNQLVNEYFFPIQLLEWHCIRSHPIHFFLRIWKSKLFYNIIKWVIKITTATFNSYPFDLLNLELLFTFLYLRFSLLIGFLVFGLWTYWILNTALCFICKIQQESAVFLITETLSCFNSLSVHKTYNEIPINALYQPRFLSVDNF